MRASSAVILLSAAIGVSVVLAKAPNKKVLTKAWSIVRESLTVEDSVVRERAVQSLEFVKDPQVNNALLSSLRDESDYVKIWAARGLSRRGNPTGKDTLIAIMNQGKNAQDTKNATGPLAALVKMRALAQGRLRGEATKALGLFNDPALLPILREAKRDNDGRVRDGAAVALALMGDNTEALVFASALKDQDKGIRLAAVEALDAMRDPRTLEPLQAVLNDPEMDVRNAAAKAVGNVAEGMTAITIVSASDAIAALLTDENGVVRETAAHALGQMGAKGKASNLKASLSDPNLYVRIAAAEALGRLEDSSGLPVLEEALNSNDIDGRAKAAHALGFIPDNNAQILAIKTLDDGNVRVRLGAAVSLLRNADE